MAVNTTVEVTMPAMGDSVSEGSILEWHKQEGDEVSEDETLVEISPSRGPARGAPEGGAPPAAAEVVDIVMPAMGESVSEGTILEWAKQPGDAVAEDEPIVEISTDKVDAEVPAPASGTLTEVLAAAGDTVTVGQVIARMSAVDGAEAPPAAR